MIARVLWMGSITVLLVAHLSCSRNTPTQSKPIVAQVAGFPIYASDVRHALGRIRLSDREGLPSIESERVQLRTALNDLIDQRIVLQAADALNVSVTIQEVESAYDRARRGWKGDKETDQCPDCTFAAALDSRKLTPADLKSELRILLTIRKYFREHVFARIAVTDEEIEDHLNTYPEIRMQDEKVRASQILVKTQADAKAVLRRLRRHVSFEDVAMEVSLSPEAKKGGDLGYFERGVMPAVFDEVCFSLPLGKISKVVVSDYGYHIFKVTGVIPAAKKPVNILRDEIEAYIRRQKEQRAQQAKLKELRDRAAITIMETVLAKI